MRRIGLAMVIVGFFMLLGQTHIVLYFLIPLMKLVYPNTDYANIANGSAIALSITSVVTIIGGIIIFFIYRNERIIQPA